MLQNIEYVAAIIPDSFLTANLFHNRLYGVVNLNCRMFDDTECPVCLALFVPELLNKNSDFFYYKGNVNLGHYSEMVKAKNAALTTKTQHDVKFNDPNGEVGLYAIDSPKGKSIRFVNGSEIDSNKIKVSSRGVTRISGIPLNADTQKVVEEANKILNDFREKTNDMFLTSFRGLREDGEYRKRLDFNTAKLILNTSIQADLEKVAERFDRSIKEKLVGAIKPLQESQVQLSKKLECVINKMKVEN